MKKHMNIKKACLLSLALVLSTSALAQSVRQYKGQIVDESGEPIIGAVVKLPGASTGTITDLEGNFQIQVPAGKSVEITHVGYDKLLVSNLNQTKLILRENNKQLDELVVVGYGAQKKTHLTGAISTVPMDEIQDLASGNLSSSLSGLVNGLSVSGGEARPGENARIYIRNADDLRTVGSSNVEPLYVIDGFIYPNDVKVGNTSENLGANAFNNLDPSTIESISVLKDAAAAVYGARAANGVILVTTKKGKLGAPKISYSGSFGVTNEVERPKMLGAYQYGRLWNAVKAADPTNTSLDKQLDLFQLDELNAMKNLNYDLLDDYWRAGFVQKHSINMSGATERANYYGGISYFDQDGNLGKLDYNRWNYRAGVSLNISKWLKTSLQISGDYGKKNKPLVKVGGTNAEKDYNLLLTHPRYIPEYVNGLPIKVWGPSNKEVNSDQSYSFSELQNSGDYSRSMSSNLSIQGSLEYDFGWSKIFKGLSLKFTYSKSISSDKSNEYGSSYKIYSMSQRAGSGKHLYTPIAGEEEAYQALMTEDNFLGSVINNGGTSYISRSMNRTDSYQINFMANYARDFGEHHVGALFSIEKSETESEYLLGSVTDPLEFTTGQSNMVGANSTQTTVFTRSESGTLSYIGRINYAYANKYLLEFLVRSDASTKFAPENYWGVFPSLSAGWVISEENWLKEKVAWLDYLKLRASFGLTGRDNTTAWQWMQTYAVDKDKGPVLGVGDANNAGSHITLNKNNAAVNRNAHWDKSYKANLGLDFQVLHNRLAVNIDGYYVWNREMLLPYNASIPGTIGTQSANVNYGKMNSYGVELTVSWKDRIGKDFKYKVSVNTGYTDNKVLLMDWETNNVYRTIQYGNRTDIGSWGMQCLGMFRSFQDIEEYFAKNNITSYMGLTKDKVRPGMLIYKDVRGALQEDGTYAGPDGIVDADNDQVRLSNRSNPYGFTMNLGADWKGISLTAQLGVSWGGYSFVPSSALKPASSLEYTNMPSFWNPDNMYVYEDIYDASGNLLMAANHNAKYPNLNYSSVNSVTSSFWRVSGTRATLNRLTLAYSIPSKYLKFIGIESCRFNVTGQNLLSFYNPYPDHFIDPMMSYGSYPTLRKFTIGVNVTF